MKQDIHAYECVQFNLTTDFHKNINNRQLEVLILK